MKKIILVLTVAVFSFSVMAQQKDKAVFVEYEPGFYANFILKDISAVEEKLEKKEKDVKFMMDQSEMDLPNTVDLYKREWANPVISQGNAGSCWAYSTISMYETEIYRQAGKKVKLSEIFIVYWEYVEKARRFVQERGNSLFDHGSEGNAVTRILKDYGAMPIDVYTGLLHGRKYHSHDAMYDEMMGYLNAVKKNNGWNEEAVLETIKKIMNHHIGEPPAEFTVDGEKYTPKSYVKDYLKFNPDDYVEILSYKQEPYWQQVEYKVPDNWWHNDDYYNIPLDEFMEVVKKSIRNGYTMSIGGDVSESGFSRKTQCALVPTYDIPSEYIDENARQFRFSNKTTTDDHGMHLVGYLEKDGSDWYLIKDSSSGSRNNDKDAPEFGYYFFHEDYVKLKMMGFTIHKDAVKDLLKKFK
ncbi:MAG: C1 family peptidase [Bacteroidales bacterium]